MNNMEKQANLSTVFTTERTSMDIDASITLHLFISEEIFIGLAILINFYLSFVSIWYTVKHGKVTLKKTNFLCCVMAVFLLLRSCALEMRVRTASISDFYCNFSVAIINILYGFNKSLPYVILWIRQKYLYENVIQKKSSEVTTRVLSWCTLVGIVLFEVILTTVLIAYLNMKSTPMGCAFANPKQFQSVFNILSPAIFAASTLLHLVLLGLVLYPLVMHILSKNICHAKLKKTIIRLGICTSICILSDLLNLVIKYVVPPKTSSILILICSCYNNIICLVAVLFTFVDPSQRFFPILKTRVLTFGPNANWSNVWSTSKRTLSLKSTCVSTM